MGVVCGKCCEKLRCTMDKMCGWVCCCSGSNGKKRKMSDPEKPDLDDLGVPFLVSEDDPVQDDSRASTGDFGNDSTKKHRILGDGDSFHDTQEIADEVASDLSSSTTSDEEVNEEEKRRKRMLMMYQKDTVKEKQDDERRGEKVLAKIIEESNQEIQKADQEREKQKLQEAEGRKEVKERQVEKKKKKIMNAQIRRDNFSEMRKKKRLDEKQLEQEKKEKLLEENDTLSIHFCGNVTTMKDFKNHLETGLKKYSSKEIPIVISQERNSKDYRNYTVVNPRSDEGKYFDIILRFNSDSYTPLPDEHGGEMTYLKEHSNLRSAIYIHLVSGVEFSMYYGTHGRRKIQENFEDFDSGVCLDTIFSQNDDFYFTQENGVLVLLDPFNQARDEQLKESFERNMEGLCRLILKANRRRKSVEEMVKNKDFL